MSLGDNLLDVWDGNVPRASGDEPDKITINGTTYQCSPRERG